MQKTILTILLLLTTNLIKAQTSDLLLIKHKDSEIGIKNVNIIITRLDTILVTDTSGIIDLSGFQNYDTLIIKKFGYKSQLITNNQKLIRLEKDTLVFSHDLELLDLKHKDGFSFLKLRINEDIYWFKQNIGPLFLGNGRELESGQEYAEVFINHKIIKTVSVSAEYCLSGFRGRNSANSIMAIYYNPDVKKRKSKSIPNTRWSSKRKMRKDARTLKLQNGCLN